MITGCRVARLVLFMVVGLATSAASVAYAQRAMTLVDLINVPRLSDPQLSPDGQQLLYVRSDADWTRNKRVEQIWRQASDGGEPRQLTRGAEGASSPRWSPDGGTIAFLARRDGDAQTQIHLMPSDGGEARPRSPAPASS